MSSHDYIYQDVRTLASLLPNARISELIEELQSMIKESPKDKSDGNVIRSPSGQKTIRPIIYKKTSHLIEMYKIFMHEDVITLVNNEGATGVYNIFTDRIVDQEGKSHRSIRSFVAKWKIDSVKTIAVSGKILIRRDDNLYRLIIV
jgi:hypothetical protein